MPEARSYPEKRAVRRAFERAAPAYDRHAVLQREVGGRLAQHLDPMRIDPRTVVDLGCGTGEAFAELSRSVGRSLSTVSRSVERMAALGYVTTQRQGRTVSVFPRGGDEVPEAVGAARLPED